MKKILILIISMVTLSSCSNDDDDSRTDPIVGEWKLIEAKLYGLQGGDSPEASIDYSGENIIYNFQSNGTLIVSGGEDIEDIGYPIGEYQYIFGEDHLGDSSSPEILLVKINDSKWTYDLTNRKMTLGKSYVDGPDLVFERK